MSDEWAKTTGKGIDAARDFGKFLAPILKSPLENAIGIWSDKLAYTRWERQQRLMIRAKEFMLEQGIEQPTRAVPMNVAIPLMQAASMEEDDVLQDLWAKLLVNAMDADSGVNIHRSYVDILESLTPLDALIINGLYTHGSHGQVVQDGVVTSFLQGTPYSCVSPADVEKVQIALWNLLRLGCIRSISNAGDRSALHLFGITKLGIAFVEACTLKPKS